MQAKPASSSWRTALSLSGLDDQGQQVSKSLLKSDVTLEDSTCFTIHNEHNFIIQGSISGKFQTIKPLQKTKNDAKQYSTTTTLLDKKDSTQSVINVFSPTFGGKFPGPIYSMDMKNDYLLIGSNNGDCFLKRMDISNEKNNIEYSSVKCTCYSHPKLKKSAESQLFTVPSPEQYTFSTRITNIEIKPEEQLSSFHTIENNRLHIWNFEKEDGPAQTIQGSRSPIWCSAWNPHNSNIIAIGGVSKTVKLIDVRNLNSKLGGDGIVMSHNDSITDVKWSPLLPYWLASSSTDGLIYIWDQRYSNEPIMKLEGHNNIVKKIAWSYSHAELLLSGGIDHTVKLWSLQVKPHYVLSTIDRNNFTDAIIDVNFSRINYNQYFALSASGELIAVNVGPQVLDPLVQSRFIDKDDENVDPDANDIHNIERNIYHRNLHQAFSDVERLATKFKEQNKLEKALKLLDICKIRTLPTTKTNNPKLRFQRELEDYSYYIPPNLSFSKKMQRPDEKKIDDLILNCKILRFVQRNEFNEITLLEKKLLDLLKKDSQRIDVSTIEDVIKLYLSHDYRRGMDLVIEIAEIFKDDFGDYKRVFENILSPTIFEVTHNQALRESGYRSLQKAFQSTDYIIDQLKLQREVISYLWEYPDSAKRIVNYVADTYLEILSVGSLRAYLNALLCLQMYDKFFIVCTKLLQKIQGFDIAVICKDLMKNVAFADFLKQLNNDILNSDLLNAVESKGYTKNFPAAKCLDFLLQTKNIVFQVFRIAIYCPIVPNYMTSILTATIQKIVTIYEYCCETLSRSTQYLPEAKKLAEEVIKRFELKKLSQKGGELPEYQSEIVKIVPILDSVLK